MSRVMIAGGTIRRARFVKLSTSANNTVLECDAGDRPIGISQLGSRNAPLPSEVADPPEAAEAGELLQVFTINAPRQDISLEIGSGGCTRGDILQPDADGKGVVATGNLRGAIALESAAAGELCQVILLLDATSTQGSTLPTSVVEFATATDNTAHSLMSAAVNPGGCVVVGAYGIVTEVFAGGSEDQGIVTVRDSDGNALCTLTPTNGGADALNDIIVGYSAPAASTGAAAKVVAANKGIEGIVTQATSGSGAAGKMKVILQVQPLA